MTPTTLSTLQRWLKLFLLILGVITLGWCSYFFYTAIYQTITAQGAILQLEPRVGRASLDLKQLETVQKNLEEKKTGAASPAPARNPFLSEPSSPRISTQSLTPSRAPR